MHWVLLVSSFAYFAVCVARCRGSGPIRERDPELPAVYPEIEHAEALVLGAALWFGGLGIVGTLWAWAGYFSPLPLAATLAALTVLMARGRRRDPRRDRPGRAGWVPVATVFVLAAVLRLPVHEYPLGGRDQGTYLLRAEVTARTGGLAKDDAILAAAGASAAHRIGPLDILGLYPRHGDAHRATHYEAAYRPGFYLSDRDRGIVRPQFFHMFPVLLAVSVLLGCPPGLLAMAQGVLGVLAVFAFAGRHFPERRIWAFLAAAVVALAPIAIWVHRNTLSETLAALLFGASAVAAQRAAACSTPQGREGELRLAGFALGCLAWARGNGLLIAPIVLLVLLGGGAWRQRSIQIYAALVVLSAGVHTFTVFPYLHDEVARQWLPNLPLTPPALAVALAVCMACGWLRDAFRPWPRVLGHLPHALTLLAVLVYAAARWTGTPGPPWSRLDPTLPLLGAPLLVLAILGASRRACFPEGMPGRWLCALASAVAWTLLLYAPRNLPDVSLYYYGRYLVPELLPAAALFATHGLRTAVSHLAGRGVPPPLTLAAGVAAMLVPSVWPLLRHPTTRLQEFQGAGAMAAALSARLEPEAIVLAGGEGWHHGHTFNQIGGALALRHGHHVLPYLQREAAYATLYELLVLRPQSHGPPPPVYILHNEATLASLGAQTEAAVDLQLPPPFRVETATFAELFVHRLTPTRGEIPHRVTRDDLRMALLRVGLDDGAEELRLRYDAALGFTPGAGAGDRFCLPREGMATFELPATPWARQLVVVADAGNARPTQDWQIFVDGERVERTTPALPHRERHTIGPIVRERPPHTLAVRGAEGGDPACPWGAVVEIRLLGLDASPEGAERDTLRVRPDRDLGHPFPPTVWTAGRSLSAYRPGARGGAAKDRSMVLVAGDALSFSPIQRPGDAGRGCRITVALTSARLDAGARLEILAGDRQLATFDPPDTLRGTWRSEVASCETTELVVAVTVRLAAAAPGDQVELRDVTLWDAEVLVR